jgi:hypothetical protein
VRFDLFSSGRLLAALEDAGYPGVPPDRTLRSWIQNDSAPDALRLFVSEVLLERKEAAPPEWAERLQERLDQIAEAQESLAQAAKREVIEALGPALHQEMGAELDALLGRDLRQPQQHGGEPVGGPTAGPGGGSLGSKRQSPK